MTARVVIPVMAASLFASSWLFGCSRRLWTQWGNQWTWSFEGDKQHFSKIEREFLSGWNSDQLITASFDAVRGLSRSLTSCEEHQTNYRNTKLPETRYTKGTHYGKEFGKRHAQNLQDAISMGKSLLYHINYDTKTVIYYHFDNGNSHLAKL